MPTGPRWHFVQLLNSDTPEVRFILCFRVLASVEVVATQANANVEFCMVECGKQKNFHASILASESLEPRDSLRLWLPPAPVPCAAVQGEGDEKMVTWMVPDSVLDKNFKKSMNMFSGMDPDMVAELMGGLMTAGAQDAEATKLRPPGQPGCPTQ